MPKPTPTRSVEELLELLGITDFRDKLGRELSTGSRRIVDLACVLAHRPSVLLLDEPSSGIAQREAEALGPLLLRIREQTGATLLVIEHDVPLLLSVCRSADRARPGGDRDDRKSRRRRARSVRREVVSRNHRSRDRPQRRAARTRPDASPYTRGDHHGHTADSAGSAFATGALRPLHRGRRRDRGRRGRDRHRERRQEARTRSRPATRHHARARRSPTCRSSTTRPSSRARRRSTRGSRTATRRPATSRSRSCNPPPCVPAPTGSNGGATSPGVTATTIKIGYYIPKPDPTYDAVARSGRRVRHARRDRAGVPGLHRRSTTAPVRALRPQDPTRAHQRHRHEHRRGRGQGRRRPGRGRRRVRGDGRTGAGAELRDRARGQAHPVHRHVRHLVAAAVARAGTRRTSGRPVRRPSRPR